MVVLVLSLVFIFSVVALHSEFWSPIVAFGGGVLIGLIQSVRRLCEDFSHRKISDVLYGVSVAFYQRLCAEPQSFKELRGAQHAAWQGGKWRTGLRLVTTVGR